MGKSTKDAGDDDARAAFALLRSCAETGRPIVPLIGAGISVASGIPPLAQIAEHLIRTYRLLQLRGEKNPRQYLLAHGWPARHAVNMELHVRRKARRLAASQAALEAELDAAYRELMQRAREEYARELRKPLRSEMGRRQIGGELANYLKTPGPLPLNATRAQADWRFLLLYLANREQGLIDSYFARLVRRRGHSTAHQFVAFLTKVFNWNPILTTNFDDLIETALRSQGLNPVVFELLRSPLQPDHLIMPDPGLVNMSGQTSIIKLHGGTHGLCADYSLDTRLPRKALATYRRYLPPDPVFLVIGYGAIEPRVLSLLDIATQGKAQKSPVVWVFRSRRPDRALLAGKVGRLHLVQAEEPGLFLHELHQRLLFTHPAGLQGYVAIHYPPSTVYPKLFKKLGFDPPQNHPRRDLLKWYNGAEPGQKASAGETRHRSSNNSLRLWFSLREFPSNAAFLATWVEMLQAADRGLPMAARPCPSGSRPASSRFHGDPAAGDVGEFDDFVLAQYREHIRNALVRYPYRIAIDTYRAFVGGLSVGERDFRAETTARETELFVRFLQGLVELGVGESRFAVAVHPVNGPQLKPVSEALTVFDNPAPPGSLSRFQRRVREEIRKCTKANVVQRALLEVAMAFRRPRSIAGLAKVTAVRLKDRMPIDPSVNDPLVDSHYGLYSQVMRAVEDLESRGILVRHDGGFYSITSEARSALLEELRKKDPGLLVQLHDRIADYYCAELYEHSRDPRAFFEYAYHRLEAAALLAGTDEYERHIDWLVATTEREADMLFAQGQSPRLIRLLHRVDRRLNRHPGRPERYQTFRDRLSRIEARLSRRAMNYGRCMEIHYEFLERTFTPAGPRTELPALIDRFHGFDSERLELASHAIELGACFNAKGWPSQGDDARAALDWLGLAYRIAESIASEKNPGDQKARAALLATRALKSLLKLEARTSAPWDLNLGQNTGESVQIRAGMEPLDPVRQRYRAAVHNLRGLGPSARIRTLHCQVRCAYARDLYLRDLFGKANVELNRAHSFGARATATEGWDAIAEYHLHRAEYCLFRALREPDSRKAATTRKWLLDAAGTALREAESTLLRGDRSAVLWLWFYLQCAWLHRDRLRSKQGSAEEELLAGLQAIAGARLNVNADTPADAAVRGLWADLREQWCVAFGKTGHPSAWVELNERAGIGPTTAIQPRYWAPAGMTVELSSKRRVHPVDMNDFGLGFEQPLGEGTSPRQIRIILPDQPVFQAVVRLVRHGKAAMLAHLAHQDRVRWNRLQNGLKLKKRKLADRRRPPLPILIS